MLGAFRYLASRHYRSLRRMVKAIGVPATIRRATFHSDAGGGIQTWTAGDGFEAHWSVVACCPEPHDVYLLVGKAGIAGMFCGDPCEFKTEREAVEEVGKWINSKESRQC